MALRESLKVLVLYFLIEGNVGRYGDPYPVSGSWFKDRSVLKDEVTTLSNFKSIGGDTVMLRGAEFYNRTAPSIAKDSNYAQCVVEGKHCVDLAKEELSAKGLKIQAWATYDYGEDYSESFVTCTDFDKKITVGPTDFHRVILWLEQYKTADDCSFTNGSRVAVLFTRYTHDSQREDPHKLLLSQAAKLNLTVYMGLPKPPRIGEDQESADLINAFFQLNYRVIQDHKARFANFSVMKGYYSDAHVIADHIINEQKNRSNSRLPARFVLMFWRELYFLTGNFGYELIASPSLDLTHAGNTTLKGYMDGMKSLAFFAAFSKVLIRDGRGDGKAAYFTAEEKNKPITDIDNSLWQILKGKNDSITSETTFADIYYASISDYFREHIELEIPTWLMIEAYDDIPNGVDCEPVDPMGSGIDRKVQRVYKERLDDALAQVGAMVQKVTAYAWDPMFTCDGGLIPNMLEQIQQTFTQPIISECRFHSPQNQSVVVIGYNLDGPPTVGFWVEYTLYNNRKMRSNLFGYYYELDYGRQHGLVESLVYVQLYDIPNLQDLKREGSITVSRTDKTDVICTFNYKLSKSRSDEIFG